MFLLDTDVLSGLRKASPDSSAVAWLRAVAPGDLYLSVITIMEIERGVGLKRKADAPFAVKLDQWLRTTIEEYSDRIIPLGQEIALRSGKIQAMLGRNDVDTIIAATAQEHGFTVVTRNVRHFAPIGIPILDPFE